MRTSAPNCLHTASFSADPMGGREAGREGGREGGMEDWLYYIEVKKFAFSSKMLIYNYASEFYVDGR